MPDAHFPELPDHPHEDTRYAQGRLPNRFYTSNQFENENQNSSDFGQPSRFVYQVFDDDGNASQVRRSGDEWIVGPIDEGRSQIKVLISREAGAIVDLWIQRVPGPNAGPRSKVKDILRLRREDAKRFSEFFYYLEHVDPVGDKAGVRIDEEVLNKLVNDPKAIEKLYELQASTVRKLIEKDAQAEDIIALAGRREALRRFEKMLTDEEFFDSLLKKDKGQKKNKGKESVWQEFFEKNPWILGVGLGAQIFTSWSEDKLEQVVKGYSIKGRGKRADALLRTEGLIRSMVFAEIKHHRTPLLKPSSYRPGVWPMSDELSGGVNQAQATVHQAVDDIGERIVGLDEEGFETSDITYLVRPRSFLIIGDRSELVNDEGQHHPGKIRSFELQRRHLQEPEVVTYDELLARAKWVVENSDH